MRRVVGALEALGGQVGIDLGRDQVGVAKQLLHAAQVRTSVQQMGRVAMPQLVRRQVRVQTGDGEVFLQAQLQVPWRDGRPLLCAGEEDRSLARRRLGQQAPVVLYRRQRRLPDGRQALLLPLAAHAQHALIPVDVLRHQPAKLADAQAARINRLQHRHVAQTGKGRGNLGAIHFALRRQKLERGGQQIGHLLRRQEFGEPFPELGQGEVLNGRSCDGPMPDQETVKRPQGAEAELDGRPAEVVPPQEPEVGAEIIPLQGLPRRGLLPLRLVPAMKLHHRLPVVALRVHRGAPIRSQVLQELLDPLVVD